MVQLSQRLETQVALMFISCGAVAFQQTTPESVADVVTSFTIVPDVLSSKTLQGTGDEIDIKLRGEKYPEIGLQ